MPNPEPEESCEKPCAVRPESPVYGELKMTFAAKKSYITYREAGATAWRHLVSVYATCNPNHAQAIRELCALASKTNVSKEELQILREVPLHALGEESRKPQDLGAGNCRKLQYATCIICLRFPANHMLEVSCQALATPECEWEQGTRPLLKL
eukprot:3644013-Alexandrium_andersonii.AAC.1